MPQTHHQNDARADMGVHEAGGSMKETVTLEELLAERLISRLEEILKEGKDDDTGIL